MYTSKRLCPRRKGIPFNNRCQTDPFGPYGQLDAEAAIMAVVSKPPSPGAPCRPPQWKIYHERDANFGRRLPVSYFFFFESNIMLFNPSPLCLHHRTADHV
jgi:hypothetical protein